MFKIIDNKKGCKAYRCKNDATPKDRFCAKHRARYNKEKNPIKYTYHALKSNANRRGHCFDLTIEQFTVFCNDTGYMDKKGKKAGSASIDRIDHTKGYSFDNIQILTLSENSKKQHKDSCPF